MLSSDALAVPLFKYLLSRYKDPEVPQHGSRRHQVLPSAPSPSRFYSVSGVDTSVAISSLGSSGMSLAAELGEPPGAGIHDGPASTSTTTTCKHVLVALGSPAQFASFTGCFFCLIFPWFGLSVIRLALALPAVEFPQQ